MAYTAQQLVDMGYGGYAGWSDEPANADFLATGGAGKGGGGGSSGGGGGGGDPADEFINNAMAPYLEMFKPIPRYEDTNPFFFDEALAEKAATAEYSPYYDELLSDYTAVLERTKSRSQQDLDRTLEWLEGGKDYYLGRERRMLDKAVRQTKEGYAGRGLYFSGAKDRDIAELKQEYGEGIGEYLRGYEYQKGGAQQRATRTGEDVKTSGELYTRDIGREKETAIAGGVLQRKGEVREEYEESRRSYYDQYYIPGLG